MNHQVPKSLFFQDSAGEASDVRGAGQEEVVERGGHVRHPAGGGALPEGGGGEQHEISEPHQQKVRKCHEKLGTSHYMDDKWRLRNVTDVLQN